MATQLPPEMLTPEYVNESRQGTIVSATIATAVLAHIAVALRLISRKLVKAPFWWDDYAMIVALGLAESSLIYGLVSVKHGLGKHVTTLPPSDVLAWVKALYWYEILYTITMASIKLSILLFYRRIFPTRKFSYALYAVGLFVTLWCIATTLVAAFQCTPIAGMWDPTLKLRCINVPAFFIGTAALNIFSDFVILALPVRQIMVHLQLPKMQKVALSGIFLLGGFVCVTSIIRASVLKQVDQIDPTWSFVNTAYWSIVEVFVGIVSACLPMMRPLFRGLMPSRSTKGSKEAGYSSGSRSTGSGFRGASISKPQISLAPTSMVPWPAVRAGTRDSFQKLPNEPATPQTSAMELKNTSVSSNGGGPFDDRAHGYDEEAVKRQWGGGPDDEAHISGVTGHVAPGPGQRATSGTQDTVEAMSGNGITVTRDIGWESERRENL
ncbi:MAG: hypothetical protein M1817_003351 [Caeruleum heppii]|nr:MAG: hypothetical protein M1817_003351 [Caeruleum heppii]